MAAALAGFVAFEAHRTAAVVRAMTLAADSVAMARRARADSEALATAGAPAFDTHALVATSPLGPPPQRDIADVRRRIAFGSNATYIGSILTLQDSLVVRWPERVRDPIRVWIEPHSTVPGFHRELVDAATQAFVEWRAADAPVRYVFVTDSAASEARVTWIARFEDGRRLGSTLQLRDQYGWIVGGTIRIATATPDGQMLPDDRIQATAVHEVGHLLGLNHATDTMSIMAPAAHTTRITGADIATLRLLYSLPPGSLKGGGGGGS
ncbi:MAG: hypothetical protein NVS1B4_17000 [Gemmatimonadaceae bacterium]